MPKRPLAILFLLTTTLVAAAPTPDSSVPDPYAVVRGMTISCPGAGEIWGTDAMVDAMRELKTMGVNWITIHPYAGIRGDGQVGSGRIDRLYGDATWLTRPIREAHRLGLKIMIKPHIAYWGSEFSWRGEIKFDTDDAWQRFFTSYEAWITMVAELSADADAFAVGTELGGTVHFEAEWRRIIAAVRARTKAPLTYAANWDRYEQVKFWDALDVIGIQGYFPLVNHTGIPTEQELEQAWSRLVRRLEGYGARHDRKIILAELGYNRSVKAAIEPWDYRQEGEQGELVQRRCMTAALKALQGSKTVSGAFLWKWFPESRRSRAGGGYRGNFIMMTPAMREVIVKEWGGAGPPR